VRLRRVNEGEAAPLRELRLRALQEASYAFATRFEEAAARPAAYWEAWTRKPIDEQVTFVAVDGERWLGMASGWLPDQTPGRAWLAQLWVDPEARRAGVGLELIEAVAGWAHERGMTALELSVTTNNPAAAALYARAGFVQTGRRRPLPSDPSRTEVFLSRPLRP
jgi:ribosomal protein S18 acetylase RimI-like enzyme